MIWPFKKRKQKPVYRRGYDAAQFNRLLADFMGSWTTEDADLRKSLVTLRNRSRDLARNNDYFKNALRIIATNVVGTGIGFQAQVKKQRGNKLDETKNDEIEWAWHYWSKAQNCDVRGMRSFQDIEALIMKGLPKNGEALIRIHRRKFGKSKVPLALEMLAPDYLDETYNRAGDGQNNEIKMGVELDEYGRPVAYHLRSKNPGESSAAISFTQAQRVRVPARDIIHLFIPEEEGQTRAAPWFASGMKRIHHMGGYEEATVVGARARASLMGFIETPEGQLTGDEVIDDQRVTEFEPGVFKKLNPGETVNVPNITATSGELDPFMKIMLRGLAAGAGMSYESLSKDYQGATYSSARQALLEDRDLWRVLQWWLIRSFHERVFEEFLDMAYLEGVLDLPLYATRPELYTNVKWMPRGWSWIDPLKEVQAYKSAVRAGFMTISQVIAQSGGDFEEYVTAREREIKILAEKGIVLDTDPKAVSGAGLTQARPVGSEAPDPYAEPSINPSEENDGKPPE